MIYSNFLLYHGFKRADTNEGVDKVCSCFSKQDKTKYTEVHLSNNNKDYEITIRKGDGHEFLHGDRIANPDKFELDILHATEVQ